VLSCRHFISRPESALWMEWNFCLSRAGVKHWAWLPDLAIIHKSSIFRFFWCNLKGWSSLWMNDESFDLRWHELVIRRFLKESIRLSDFDKHI
jgi:hypothetical protein